MKDWDDPTSVCILLLAFCAWTGLWVFQGYECGYRHALQQAYRNQGRLAAQSGVPVTEWPYHDYDGPEFQWVVGWHEASKKEASGKQ